jgi:Siphovirus Gp157
MAAQPLPFKVPARTAKPQLAEREMERQRAAGFKRAIDRVDTVLTRLEDRAAACDVQIKFWQARKKLALARAAAIEERTLELMAAAGLEKLLGNRATLAKRANALSVVVDNQKLIPAAYLRTKTTREADKVAIKVALERGEEVAGVHLVQTVSLIRK